MTDDNLSDFGKLNRMRADLVEFRDSTGDEGLRNRCNILISNIDGLKKDPNDEALMKQFAQNTADLERYRASKFTHQ